MYVYIEYDFIQSYIRWSVYHQEHIENNSGVQTPLKTKQKSKYATEKMRYSHLDGCYFSPYSSSTPWQ